MNTAVCVILERSSLVKTMCVVVHEKRITTLFLLTLFTVFQHYIFRNKEKLYACASSVLRVRIIFLKDKGNGMVFHCRSPPLTSI